MTLFVDFAILSTVDVVDCYTLAEARKHNRQARWVYEKDFELSILGGVSVVNADLKLVKNLL